MGFLGPDFLLCHALPFDEADRQAMVRTKAPVSFSVHSELRLGTAGGFHGQLLRMLAAGVTVSLSFDAGSLAPINMFESMNVAWNLGIPYLGTDTANLPASYSGRSSRWPPSTVHARSASPRQPVRSPQASARTSS